MDDAILLAKVVGILFIALLGIAILLLGVFFIDDQIRWYRRHKALMGELQRDSDYQDQKEKEREKKRLLEAKEREARNTFLQDQVYGYYPPGFDKNGDLISKPIKVPTEKAFEYYRKMDELTDTLTMKVLDEDI